MLGRPAAAHQVARRVHERDMGQRLRHVAERAVRAKVVFLGQQADVVAQREQPLVQCHGLVAASAQRQIVGKPERAWQEEPFAGRQSIDVPGRAIAQHEAVDGELALDRFDRRAHARILVRQEADERHEQQARVERRRSVALHEHAARVIDALRAHLGMDARAHVAPVLDRAIQAVALHRLDRAIDRHPRHHPGVGERLRIAAHLPDAAVRLLPVVREEIDERPLHVPRIGVRVEPRLARDLQRVHQLAVNVQLRLHGSGVADANGRRPLVARKPRHG
jgi:hypothetical protein